jgi:hypothetical protein
LNTPLSDILWRALDKQGHASLKTFYQRHSFSFSYEYIRKIFSGERVPQPKKIVELAVALEMDTAALQRRAASARLERKVRRHYRLPSTTGLGHLRERIKPYRQAGKTDAKLIGLIEQLGESEKQQLLHYLRFLRKQWRSIRKKPKKRSP